GLDVFLRVLFGVDDPEFIHYGLCGGLNVATQTEHWEVSRSESRHGNVRTITSTIRTPDGTLTQGLSITEVRRGTFLYACTNKPIKDPKDLQIADKHEPGLPQGWEQKIRKKIATLKAALGDDGILGVWGPMGPFNNASFLIDHEELYSLFLLEPEYYRKLMGLCIRRTQQYTRVMDEAGVDVFVAGGNVPGGFIGKRSYDQYVLPYEKQTIEFAQRSGKPCIYHNCGEIMNLVESYKELGVRVVEPFSPPPLGDADLAEAKKRVDGDYIMLAGLDQVNVLHKGTVDQVKRATEQAMEIGKPGGKFIIQNVDYLEYGTPTENLEAFAKTALDLAAY
ncbi:MAG: uroporphyrinogen decarboxylase family protein, partial [Planctomycetota bacterium]